MPGATPVSSLPYPLGTDPISDGDDQIHALASALDGVAWTLVGLVAGWTGSLYVARRANMVTLVSNITKSTAYASGEAMATLTPNFRPNIPAGLVMLLVGQGGGQIRTLTLDNNGVLKTGEAASTAMSPWGTWSFPAGAPQT